MSGTAVTVTLLPERKGAAAGGCAATSRIALRGDGKELEYLERASDGILLGVFVADRVELVNAVLRVARDQHLVIAGGGGGNGGSLGQRRVRTQGVGHIAFNVQEEHSRRQVLDEDAFLETARGRAVTAIGRVPGDRINIVRAGTGDGQIFDSEIGVIGSRDTEALAGDGVILGGIQSPGMSEDAQRNVIRIAQGPVQRHDHAIRPPAPGVATEPTFCTINEKEIGRPLRMPLPVGTVMLVTCRFGKETLPVGRTCTSST